LVWKIDQLLFLYSTLKLIAFSNVTFHLIDKHALRLDRFFFGGTENLETQALSVCPYDIILVITSFTAPFNFGQPVEKQSRVLSCATAWSHPVHPLFSAPFFFGVQAHCVRLSTLKDVRASSLQWYERERPAMEEREGGAHGRKGRQRQLRYRWWAKIVSIYSEFYYWL